MKYMMNKTDYWRSFFLFVLLNNDENVNKIHQKTTKLELINWQWFNKWAEISNRIDDTYTYSHSSIEDINVYWSVIVIGFGRLNIHTFVKVYFVSSLLSVQFESEVTKIKCAFFFYAQLKQEPKYKIQITSKWYRKKK